MNLSQSEPATRAAFVMEQHIGHRTYYQNLRQFMHPALAPRWTEITYEDPASLWDRMSFLPGSLRGPLVGRAQALGGLRGPYDVAFFNTQVPAMLSGGITQRKPFVISMDITPLQYDQMAAHYGHQPDLLTLVRYLKNRLNRVLFQRAARVLPWSSWTARSLIEDYGIAPERIEVLPPGIDLERWQPADHSSSELPVRILFVGGDFYRKGGQVLLDAFRRLPPGQARLDLVTRTELPPEPGVRVYHYLQPNTPDLIHLYQAASIFVLPSLAEAFGIAAVEAAAAGLPVIASQVGGLTDIVVDDRNGFLVPPADAASLTDRLETLISNPQMRRQMGQNGRFRAEQYFDARKNAARIAELLIEIATSRKPS